MSIIDNPTNPTNSKEKEIEQLKDAIYNIHGGFYWDYFFTSDLEKKIKNIEDVLITHNLNLKFELKLTFPEFTDDEINDVFTYIEDLIKIHPFSPRYFPKRKDFPKTKYKNQNPN
jgi:hypothetical protein